MVLRNNGSISTKLTLISDPYFTNKIIKNIFDEDIIINTELFIPRMGSKAGEYVSRTSIGAYFHSARESRKLVLVIVAIALLLDNMLLTTVGELAKKKIFELQQKINHFPFIFQFL